MRRFEGVRVLVTGGGGGIGRCTAIEFAREGATLVLCDIDGAGGAETVRLIEADGGSASFVRADVSKRDEVERLFAEIRARGTLDIAINNAGVEGKVALLAEQDEANFDHVMGVNVRGTFLCLQAEAAIMRAQGKGVIVNLASIAAHVGFAGLTLYTASKAAVLAMTKSAALELAKDGIRVVSVSPGLVDTAMLDRFLAAGGATRAEMTAGLPLGRACEAMEIARGVLFAASDDAILLIGQTLNLDGGWAYVKP